MNSITVVGNLGADVEELKTQSGTTYYRISVATTENWKDKDGNKQSHTTWHKCMLYGNYQNLAPYLRKGTCVAVTGRQRNDQVEYKSNGQVVMFDNKPIKTTYPFIKVDNIELHGGGGNQQQQQQQPQAGAATAQPQAAAAQASAGTGQNPPSPPYSMVNDDLPF